MVCCVTNKHKVVFTGVKPTDQMLACAWACEWDCVMFGEYHRIIYTCKPFVILISLLLLCYTGPPKVKERDLDLKHKSSLQALELSLPLNAADQCPFLLKIKPF